MFNSQSGDVFGCVADLGWMAGHTMLEKIHGYSLRFKSINDLGETLSSPLVGLSVWQPLVAVVDVWFITTAVMRDQFGF